jgi:cytosine/adenosine deaminase-related metal-dependent hydrolase
MEEGGRLYTARYVITGEGIFSPGALVTGGGRILFAGAEGEAKKRFPGLPLTAYGEAAISPSFVNAHMHLYGVLAHGIKPPFPVTSFESFLGDYWWPLVENRLDAPMLAAAAGASALELIESGVTCVCDCMEAPNTSGQGLEEEAGVLERLGLRAVLSVEASERISPENGRLCLRDNLDFLSSRPGSSLVSGCLCLHTAFTCSRPFIEEAAAMAAKAGTDIQLHLNESVYEPEWCEKRHAKRTALWYEEIGLLGENLIAAQCVQLSPEEMDALARHGVRTVHVPLSNCEVGGGIAPVPDLLDRGLAPALGTDGYINNFFEVMRGAFLIHKGHRRNAALMDAKTVWTMATENGARAVYGGRLKTGRLAEGYEADFIVIDTSDLPSALSTENLLEELILYRNPQDLRDVYAAGRALKKDGLLVTGDKKAAAKQAALESERLGRRLCG